MKKLSTALLTALMLGVSAPVAISPVLAQDGVSEAEADPRVVLAEELIALTVTDTMVEQMVDAVWPTLEEQLVALNPDISEDALMDLKAKMVELERELVADMTGKIVTFYTETFTEDELTELNAFYASELGQKLLDSQPELMSQVMPDMIRQVQTSVPLLMEDFLSYAEEQGFEIGEDA
jgi:hypothetical protein